MANKSEKGYTRFHTEIDDEDVLVDVLDNGKKIYMTFPKSTDKEMMDGFVFHANVAARDLLDIFLQNKK